MTTLLSNLLGSYLRSQNVDRPSATILFATASGEKHSFGLLAAALLAVSAGFRTVFLGAEVPASEIVLAARKSNSDAVIVAGYDSWPPTHLVDLQHICSNLPEKIRFCIGGPIALTIGRSHTLNRSIRLADYFAFESYLKRWSGRT